MRILIISKEGEGLGLGTHLSSEGHLVQFALDRDDKKYTIGQGVVNTEATDTPADLVIFDDPCYGKQAEDLRRGGTKVLGSSKWSQLIDEDTEYASSIIASLGWNTTQVNTGINLYLSAWFNGNDYVARYTSLVYKRLMSAGRGPDVQFTGVVGNFSAPTRRLEEEIYTPLSKILKKTSFHGCIFLHLLTSNQEYSVKGISTKFAHPLANILYENAKATKSEILLKLINEDSKPLNFMDTWGCGIMLSTPPYPYPLDCSISAIKGVNPGNLKHLWLIDVAKNNGQWQTSGLSGKVGYVTARGESPYEAVKRAYRTIGNLDIKDLQYRDDIGRNINSLLNTLKSGGWLDYKEERKTWGSKPIITKGVQV